MELPWSLSWQRGDKCPHAMAVRWWWWGTMWLVCLWTQLYIQGFRKVNMGKVLPADILVVSILRYFVSFQGSSLEYHWIAFLIILQCNLWTSQNGIPLEFLIFWVPMWPQLKNVAHWSTHSTWTAFWFLWWGSGLGANVSVIAHIDKIMRCGFLVFWRCWEEWTSTLLQREEQVEAHSSCFGEQWGSTRFRGSKDHDSPSWRFGYTWRVYNKV